ncbi:MAG: recombinase RecT [Hyphomicrobiaceae bacterium]|nr:recombinase RecT [Hyphomicrobiaceae bacterium]MCK5550756.1 recombinase RecT [Hyphomicrobiaceae bacterium]
MSTEIIVSHLHAKRGALAAAVPKTFRGALTQESIVQAVGLACERSPNLRKCDPQTVYTSVLFLVRMGLDVSGYTGEAYLVPFYNSKAGRHECTPMVGQQGKIAMAYRSGKIDRILTGVAHAHDDYEFDLASGYLRHTFDPTLNDRGPAVFAWARVWVKDSTDPLTEIMPAADFQKIEDAAKKKNRGKLSPAYKQWRDEMFRRSVLSRCLKRAPKSTDIAEVLNRESSFAASTDPIDVSWTDAGTSAPDVIDAEPEAAKPEEKPANKANDNNEAPPILDGMP